MRFLLFIILLSGVIYGQDYIPGAYTNQAIEYCDALDSAQWVDVKTHVDMVGFRSAAFAALEGSNRERGQHEGELSYGDLGIWLPTAKSYYPEWSEARLLDSLLSHEFTMHLSSLIDTDNIALERKRGSERPLLNAAMRYHRGKSWRAALRYGLRHGALVKEIKKRLEKSE